MQLALMISRCLIKKKSSIKKWRGYNDPSAEREHADQQPAAQVADSTSRVTVSRQRKGVTLEVIKTPVRGHSD